MEELLEAAKLFHALSDNKFTNAKTLMSLIGNKSVKTLERRLKIIKKDFKSFELVNLKDRGYKLIPANEDLQEKSKKIVNKKVLFDDTKQEGLNSTMAKIDQAITRRTAIRILNYWKVAKSNGKEYKVVPILMQTGNDPYIYAIDMNDLDRVKQFKLKRGEAFLFPGSIEKPYDINKYREIIKNSRFDDFGFTEEKNNKIRTVTLHLNSYSMNMVEHDFPLLAKKRIINKKSKKPADENEQNKFEYTLEVNYCNIKPIGRLVTGMLNHIKVEGSKEVTDELRDFVRMTVVDSIDKI